MRLARRRALVAVSVVVSLAAPAPAPGNGGTLRLARVPAGPYLVSVWTQPDPARVGQLDVSVAIMKPDSGEAVLDAMATAHARPPTSGGPTSAPRALERGGGGNRLLYHGLVDVPARGRWDISVRVQGPAGSGETSFAVDVRGGLPPLWAFVIGAIALAAAVIAWGRRPRGNRGARVAALGIALTLALAAAPHDAAAFDPARYRPGTIGGVAREGPSGTGLIVRADVPIRTTVAYSAVFRPFASDSHRVVVAWAKAMGLAPVDDHFQRELRVDEDRTTYWLPVQETVAERMTAELRTGERLELFVIYIGHVDGRPVLLINAFSNGGGER